MDNFFTVIGFFVCSLVFVVIARNVLELVCIGLYRLLFNGGTVMKSWYQLIKK